MVKMGITKRRSHGLLASANLFLVMIISIFICTDKASATNWKDVCTLGDTYIERDIILGTGSNPYTCDYCIAWCRTQCSNFGTTALKNPCKYNTPTTPVNCQCCCSKRPSTSPQLPPTPPSVGQFTGGDITDICTFAPQQTYLQINHAQGTDCVMSPQCENKCQESGLLSAGSQCVGTLISGATSPVYGGTYTWIEQCCCRTPPPPPPSPPTPSPPPPSPSPPPPSPPPSPSPPSPSPPPPSPPPSPPPPSPSPTPPPSPPTPPCPSPPSPGACRGCCNSNIDIQISVKSGCNVKLSTPSSLSASL
ncbi:hypothetical protein C5167_026569 [Papaver somniferum]|uniref:formin-like protein 20 n=1 Tax=Papaver somniferum TaxID=3469 RepID=UPI000E6FFE57|nr:formin-like protein 20 [Papaver somniferum]RZC85896.1 hypothetical protein C5167_026569 [Papaver somniferum]